MKIIIFGAGSFGNIYAQQENSAEIVAFTDNNNELWGKIRLGHKIIPPKDILNYEFDKIVICIDDYTMDCRTEGAIAMDEIYIQLLVLGIDECKILVNSINGITIRYDPRIIDLRKLAADLWNVSGHIAECGVLRGHFAGYINEIFNDRKLYLFDTFSGFDIKDIREETSKISKQWLNDYRVLFQYGNEKIALARCPFRENVIIRKGYIPKTFTGLETEQFAFVNLDMDLYQPTLESLLFFIPRMSRGGIIWVYDYYNVALPGVKQAIDELEVKKKYKVIRIPTGDEFTVALCGFENYECK